MTTKSKIVFLVANGPHKPPMVELKRKFEQLEPDFSFKLVSPFLLAWKIRRIHPFAIYTYNKNLFSKSNVDALIEYCTNGGRLISLHHNISSMMMRRPEWLEFAKIQISRDPPHPWSVIEGGDLFLTNLQPNHFITTNNVKPNSSIPKFDYSNDITIEQLSYELASEEISLLNQKAQTEAIHFPDSEYFINHIPLPDLNRTILFSNYFRDPVSKRQFYSANGGWVTKRGQGLLFYFMPGHSTHDYHDIYCRILQNCLHFDP